MLSGSRSGCGHPAESLMLIQSFNFHCLLNAFQGLKALRHCCSSSVFTCIFTLNTIQVQSPEIILDSTLYGVARSSWEKRGFDVMICKTKRPGYEKFALISFIFFLASALIFYFVQIHNSLYSTSPFLCPCGLSQFSISETFKDHLCFIMEVRWRKTGKTRRRKG